MVSRHLGIDVDVSILEANDFLVKQIGILMKILEKDNVRLKLNDEERRQLAELGAKLDPKKRDKYSMLVTGETILCWHRRLIGKLVESKKGERKGAPPVTDEERQQVIRMARENPNWGLLRISGELKKLGLVRCATSVRNILKNAGIEPPPLKCRADGSWKRFMDIHSEVWQTDFAVYPVLNLFNKRVTNYYIQLFINIRSREVVLGGVTSHPNAEWMKQSARNISGFEMEDATLLIRDNDQIYQSSFDAIFEANGTKVAPTCVAAPDMNAFIERFILSLKSESLSHLMIFSKGQLQFAVQQYIQFYNTQRPHQGLDNEIPKPPGTEMATGEISCRERLGGLLKSYERLAA
jgi:transposase InsO family protein